MSTEYIAVVVVKLKKRIRTDYATDTDTMQSILKPVIGPKKEVHDLGGRVALITGGALGIGLAPAIS